MTVTSSSTTKAQAALPNILTIARILSIPFIVYGILSQTPLSELQTEQTSVTWLYHMTIVVFFLAVLTDFFDGFFARRWNATSDFGRMIDSIADKLFVAGCLIALTIITQGVWSILIPAMVIIFRDILVSGAREHAALSNRVMPPTQLARWKTALEMLALLILIISAPQILSILDTDSRHVPLFMLGLALLWLAALLSIYTGTGYFRAALTPAPAKPKT